MIEGVNQPQPLIKELLRLRVRSGNGMMQAPQSHHQLHRLQSAGILRPACAGCKCDGRGRDFLHKDLQKSGIADAHSGDEELPPETLRGSPEYYGPQALGNTSVGRETLQPEAFAPPVQPVVTIAFRKPICDER